ncbi:MAG TPA: hypothetical protein VE974_02910 [Thermoanaerobaculia bacterium]|nr:hypothetical protein [Thermoanaerobaculia bacterium]
MGLDQGAALDVIRSVVAEVRPEELDFADDWYGDRTTKSVAHGDHMQGFGIETGIALLAPLLGMFVKDVFGAAAKEIGNRLGKKIVTWLHGPREGTSVAAGDLKTLGEQLEAHLVNHGIAPPEAQRAADSFTKTLVARPDLLVRLAKQAA